jgi:hypothetical protein
MQQWFLFFNFVMLLQWQSYISTYSQSFLIFKIRKYKILSTLWYVRNCGGFWGFFFKNRFGFLTIFFLRNSKFLTEYFFLINYFHQKENHWWGMWS